MPPVNGYEGPMMEFSNGIFSPRSGAPLIPEANTVYIMWCTLQKFKERKGVMWQPNHFVPLCPVTSMHARKAEGSCDKIMESIFDGGDHLLTGLHSDVDRHAESSDDMKDDQSVMVISSDEDDGGHVAAQSAKEDELAGWSDLDDIINELNDGYDAVDAFSAQGFEGSSVDANHNVKTHESPTKTVVESSNDENSQQGRKMKRTKCELDKSENDNFTSTNNVQKITNH